MTWNKLLIINALILTLSCSQDNGHSSFSNKKVDVKPKEVANLALSEAAVNGALFEGNYYAVITEEKVLVFRDSSESMVRANFQLNRGEIYSRNTEEKPRENLLPVTIPEKSGVFYIPESSEHFDQPLEGMRFLVQGTITDDNAEMEFYNTEVGKRVNRKLDVGTNYFFVNYKDCAVINVWQDKASKPIEGMYCGTLNILQANDHIKINPKYASTLDKWFLNK